MAFQLTNEERYKACIKAIPEFNGKKGNHALDWLNKLETKVDNEANLKKAVLLEKMSGRNAAAWLNELPHNVKNMWQPLRVAFIQEWVPPLFFTELRSYLEKRKQLRGESVGAYYQAIKGMLQKLGDEAPRPSKIYGQFWQGLRRHIKKQLTPEVKHAANKDLERLVTQAFMVEQNIAADSG